MKKQIHSDGGELKLSANQLTAKILDSLFRNGIFGWRQNSQGTYDVKLGIFRPGAKKGVSDILGVIPEFRDGMIFGRFLAIEVKIGRDKLRPEQIGFLQNVQHCGGITYVAKTYPDYLAWFERTVKPLLDCG